MRGPVLARRRSLLRMFFVVAVLAFGAALPVRGNVARAGAARPPKTTVVDQFSGCYAFSGGARERQALDAAIDKVADEFNFLVRGIVRGRLKSANPIASRLCFERRGDGLVVSLDRRRYRAPLNGKAVRVQGITGDELSMRFELKKGELWQIFEGEDGGRVNIYRPTKSRRIDMRVRVFSERLPRDLLYSLTYREKRS